MCVYTGTAEVYGQILFLSSCLAGVSGSWLTSRVPAACREGEEMFGMLFGIMCVLMFLA
jgi:hypothetical protein